MSETIGFIGLGRLGLPVATNLLQAGYSLAVYNRTASKAEPLIAQGARLAARPADAVAAGGVVATLVWDDEALESVVMSEGFLENLGQGGIHISMSTVSPETSRKLASIHAARGSTLVEAPIFGRPEAAEERKLLIPLAGPKDAKDRVRPILAAMGGEGLYDFGEEAGAATLVKLVGNFLIVSAGHSLGEALTIAEKNGVDPVAVADMLTQTLFNAPIYQSYGKRIAQKQAPFGQSKIPMKDVGLLAEAARRAEAPSRISGFLHELLRSEAE
ncbi:NAD(P)-dependent oxidoreductase [Cohnella zeiphila]|uniref:NAD(P)-dependent oxidoreductase n=1 Tax=Cohnella zeiphila TaxID=2761120 RepID=A0A7X0SJ96_9BACL|nr:NAD(P)-dependent oxidoreductase [Cohnella zeiphila]MBB6730999.1 NAD(P)-dependent oxidoreductase [Cohnella zeiphila]